MPARSTRVFLANNTSQVLHNLGAKLDHGAWTNDKGPPASVNPGQVGYWESESHGVATGTEGHITFSIGDAPQQGKPPAHSMYLHWDNPYSGHNKYNLTVSPGFQCFRDAGSGNNANLHVTLRPAVPHESGFVPSQHGFKFSNHWDKTPYSLPPLKGSILDYKYGNAASGLCGGMVDAARDFWQAKKPIPAMTTAPPGEQSPLFNYLVKRIFDTFDVDDVSLYLKYMNPAYPDTDENVASSLGVADGRASVVINTEWPIIRADIDGHNPSCLGLVTVKSLNPGDLGHCHQVLAYKYLEDGTNVTLWVYDPNQKMRDDITLQFSTQDWSKPLRITHNVDVHDGGHALPIYCFFRTHYSFHQPPNV